MTFDQPQGAGSPSATPVPSEPQASLSPAPTSKTPRNTLGLVALIIAVVGFIFACIPGALIVGWVLLPIAFILGLVSLFMKGRGKGLGLAAIILSVVGTVVAVVQCADDELRQRTGTLLRRFWLVGLSPADGRRPESLALFEHLDDVDAIR